MRLVACLLLLLSLAAAAQDLNYEIYRLERRVDAIYARKGLRHTPLETAGLPAAQASYLETTLHLLDVAVAARDEAETALARKTGPAHYEAAMRELLDRLDELKPPAELKSAHATLTQALNEQYSYLDDWVLDPNEGEDPFDLRVRDSHRHFGEAYDLLLSALGAQAPQDAIYDRVHALDLGDVPYADGAPPRLLKP